MALSPTSYNLTPTSTGLAVYFLTAPQGAVQVMSPVDANGVAFATAADVPGGGLVSSEPALLSLGSTSTGTSQKITGGTQTFPVGANSTVSSDFIDVSRYRKYRLIVFGANVQFYLFAGVGGGPVQSIIQLADGGVTVGDTVCTTLTVRCINNTSTSATAQWYLWLER